MFPTAATLTHIVKVTLGDDTRRLSLTFPSGASPAAAFAILREEVRGAFNVSSSSALVLKYTDDEGDLCTLADVSMEDLVSLASGRPWRLWASSEVPPSPSQVTPLSVCTTPSETGNVAAVKEPVTEATASGDHLEPGTPEPEALTDVFTAEAAGRVCANSSPPPVESSSSGSRDEHKEEKFAGVGDEVQAEAEADEGEEEDSPWEPACGMAFHLLPWVSHMAQSEHSRGILNQIGIDDRSSCLRFSGEVLEHLDLVPEAAPLRSRLQAYVEGSDEAHFGEVLADLLKAWASSASPEAVQDALAMHHRSCRTILKKAFKSMWKCKGQGKGKCKGSGAWAAWKGKGKGKCNGEFACGQKGFPWGHTAVGGLAGGLAAGPPGALFGMFAAHALAKGKGKSWPWVLCSDSQPAETVTPVATAPAATAASSEAAPSPEEAAAPAQDSQLPPDASVASLGTETSVSEADFSREVETLLEMGFTVDRDVARELLRAQDGDVSKVAAVLAFQ